MERLLNWLSRSHFGFFRSPLPVDESDAEDLEADAEDQEALEIIDVHLERLQTNVDEAEQEIRDELAHLADDSTADPEYLRELGAALEHLDEMRAATRRMRGESAAKSAERQPS